MNLRRLGRAEYVSRPGQLFRRLWRATRTPFSPGRIPVRLPWGFPIEVNPRESIGRALAALSVLDLTVTESLWRLTDDGETCVDAGANIGAMTAVFAARLRTGGTIWSCEPLPALADALLANLEAWRPRSGARFEVQRVALADINGEMELHQPADHAQNQGTASLLPCQGVSATCIVRRLDDLLPPATRVGVMKLDVEGAEAGVLRGADLLLRTGRIRDIVFEEHRPWPAEAAGILQDHGYQLWRITRGQGGPILLPPDTSLSAELDPPTYLASLEPARVQARFTPSGWLCLCA